MLRFILHLLLAGLVAAQLANVGTSGGSGVVQEHDVDVDLCSPYIYPVDRRSESLIVPETPTFVRPYVLRNLDGTKLQLADDVFRILVSNESSGGAFTLLGTNGKQNEIVPVHYHSRFYETFFCLKGRINVWVDDEVRILGPHDFAAVPHFQNHSYQFVEPDTQLTGFIQPGGFEAFFLNVSTAYNPEVNAPFPPDKPIAFPVQQFFAVADDFDVHVTNAPLNFDIENGTSPGGIWHDGNNTIPTDGHTPYYIASNWGPLYLNEELGQVIVPRATPESSGGNFSISTIVMRQRLASDTIPTHTLSEPCAIQILEGLLIVKLEGHIEVLSTGDVLFVPGGTPLQYWAAVNFVKFYVAGTGSYGLDVQLMAGAKAWPYAVFPDYA